MLKYRGHNHHVKIRGGGGGGGEGIITIITMLKYRGYNKINIQEVASVRGITHHIRKRTPQGRHM